MNRKEHAELREELLAEFQFLHEGLRQDQRERSVFLGFALAASSAILGLLVRGDADRPTADQAFVLIGIAFSIAIVAELLTIRATIGVASAGHYLREFVEPRLEGLNFQTRNRDFYDELRKGGGKRFRGWLLRASVSGSSALAVAYSAVSAGLVIAWFLLDLSTARGCWRSGLIIAAAVMAASLSGLLWWMATKGATAVSEAWAAVNAGADGADAKRHAEDD